jgi:tetratricopeptide (TPR) repeat protein
MRWLVLMLSVGGWLSISAAVVASPETDDGSPTTAPPGEGVTPIPLEGVGTSADEVLAAFVRDVTSNDGYPAAARDFIQAQWQQRRGTAEADALLGEALALLHPDYKALLDAVVAGDPSAAIESARALLDNDDGYLAAAAASVAVQLLMELDRPLDAYEVLVALCERQPSWPARSVSAAELYMFLGYGALAALDYDLASVTLETFLQSYPAAPERMRRSAEQMLRELSERQPRRLGDVYDLMKFAERELKHSRTDDEVRVRQEEAVALLDQLITEAEEREQAQSSGSSGGRGGSGRGAPGGLRPGGQPASRSMLPGGPGGDVGELREPQRVRPGEAWGAMPPREREALLQALQKQFPSQYRDLVEQYYRQLAREEERP